MISIDIIDYKTLIAFWLVFTRWLAIMIQLPILDNISIPMVVKVLTTLIISFIFFPHLQNEILKDISYLGVENFWALTIFQAMIGLLIGYLVKAIMSLFVSAGAIITQQIGFAAVRYFDPNSSQQVGPFEKLIEWTVLILIITSGALIPMFKGVYSSFYSIHIYDLGHMSDISIFFLKMFKGIFMSALLLSGPLIFTNMLIMSILGIIARTVPQMNVIMVSFVVNIGLGLLVFSASSEEFFHMAFKLYSDKLGDWFQFII